VLKNYSDDNLNSKKSNCGRKRILCNKELSDLRQVINGDRFTPGPKLGRTASSMFNKTISSKTVKRYANLIGFQARKPKKVPLLSKKQNCQTEFCKTVHCGAKNFLEKCHLIR